VAAVALGVLASILVTQVVFLGPSDEASVVIVSTPGHEWGWIQVIGTGWHGGRAVVASWYDGDGGSDDRQEQRLAAACSRPGCSKTTRYVLASVRAVNGRFHDRRRAACCFPVGTDAVVVRGAQRGQEKRGGFEFWL
jgi:hypothetical protein